MPEAHLGVLESWDWEQKMAVISFSGGRFGSRFMRPDSGACRILP